jgi:lipopolysaccharide transport system ATP-binding protein
MSNIIEFHDIWKKFRKGEKLNSLRDSVPAFFSKMIKGQVKREPPSTELDFWALKNINFAVERGSVVGILGPNGAGKSTILKLLSRIFFPTKGTIKIGGRISALIEVTAGFHPELTGRENVYLNGTILGMRRKEIDRKFDEIVEFSGITEFIDTPVKRYSSGMYSRLGFSVAAHLDPEILLVDEVLSVGDSTFQAKCAERMRELLKSGATILLVSHNLSLIQSLCKRAILINHGEVQKDGSADEVLPFYENLVIQQREYDISKKIAAAAKLKVGVTTDPMLEIPEVVIKDAQGQSRESFYPEEDLELCIHYDAKKRIEKPVFRVDILRGDGVLCCSCISLEDQFIIDEIKGQGTIALKLDKLSLAPNVYVIKISVLDRELIHSYAVRYKDILKIGADKPRLAGRSVFLPQGKWEKV